MFTKTAKNHWVNDEGAEYTAIKEQPGLWKVKHNIHEGSIGWAVRMPNMTWGVDARSESRVVDGTPLPDWDWGTLALDKCNPGTARFAKKNEAVAFLLTLFTTPAFEWGHKLADQYNVVRWEGETPEPEPILRLVDNVLIPDGWDYYAKNERGYAEYGLENEKVEVVSDTLDKGGHVRLSGDSSHGAWLGEVYLDKYDNSSRWAINIGNGVYSFEDEESKVYQRIHSLRFVYKWDAVALLTLLYNTFYRSWDEMLDEKIQYRIQD